MYPVLFKIGFVTIYSYGFFLTFGFLATSFLIWREGRKSGFDEEKILDYILWITLGGFLGARIFFVFAHWNQFFPDWQKIFTVWNVGGFNMWGAFAGGLIFALFFFWKQKWPKIYMLDLTVFGLIAGQALERLGALIGGLSVGKQTSLFWGIEFLGFPDERHPVSFYQSLVFLLGFVVLNYFWQKKKKEGTIVFAYFIVLSFIQIISFLFQENQVWWNKINLTLISSFFIMMVGIVGFYFVNSSQEARRKIGFGFLSSFDPIEKSGRFKKFVLKFGEKSKNIFRHIKIKSQKDDKKE